MIQQRHINPALVRQIARRLGINDLIAWIEDTAEALALTSWGEQGVVLGRSLLSSRGIVGVTETNIAENATLQPEGAGYRVLSKKGIPREIARFAIAHEIGHTYFLAAEAGDRPLVNAQWRLGADPTIEHICDRFAAALLMPMGKLKKLLAANKISDTKATPPLHLLPEVMRQYRVPEQAAARRLCYDVYCLNVALICVREVEKASHLSTWQTSWATLPPDLHAANQVEGIKVPLKSYGRVIPPEWIPTLGEGDKTVLCALDGRWWVGLIPCGGRTARTGFARLPEQPLREGFSSRTGNRMYLALPL